AKDSPAHDGKRDEDEGAQGQIVHESWVQKERGRGGGGGEEGGGWYSRAQMLRHEMSVPKCSSERQGWGPNAPRKIDRNEAAAISSMFPSSRTSPSARFGGT